MAVAIVNKEECVGCESCVGVCPVSAISMDDGKAVVDATACVECGACVATCPVGAIAQDQYSWETLQYTENNGTLLLRTVFLYPQTAVNTFSSPGY